MKGDDGGCFAAALASVRRWGGVLEHPEGSHAWAHFGLNKPPRAGGWIAADFEGGWTCCVEQGRYGHYARKPTWLLVYGVRDLPDLRWGKTEAQYDPAVVARMGLKRAKRLGEVGAHRYAARVPRPSCLDCAHCTESQGSIMGNWTHVYNSQKKPGHSFERRAKSFMPRGNVTGTIQSQPLCRLPLRW